MAVVIDASTPAGANSSSASCTTASFTPAASSLIVALGTVNSTAGGAPTGTVTDSLGSTWTRLARQNAGALGCAEIWALDIGASPAARTITMTSSTNRGCMVLPLVLTGAANVAGQTATPVLQGTTSMQAAITTTQVGSLVVCSENYNFTSTTLTLNANTTLVFRALDSTQSATYSALRSTATTVTPGSVTIGYTDTGFAAVEMCLLEILPSGGAAAVQGGETFNLNPGLLPPPFGLGRPRMVIPSMSSGTAAPVVEPFIGWGWGVNN